MTVPVAVPHASACLPCVGDVDELSGDTGPHINTGYAPPALIASRGFRRPDCPSAGWGKTRTTNPSFCDHGLCGGGATGPRYGHPRYTVLESTPSMPLLSLVQTGRGRKRKAEYCREVGVERLWKL